VVVRGDAYEEAPAPSISNAGRAISLMSVTVCRRVVKRGK
jgi:formate-dependent phosphoribosylglycinamide formyltransferase (GAR transformylase)